ncbi:hypothetical protein PPYR_06866 [Photinus pyralis]|uniref:Uncharacterized protein n=1 Tax=Photinus pyralis TaxID=7054 RepID=A0A5N4ANU8_PHOPY|nr:uncharacterized protein LOC116169356 isoform X2 [Photinus pyralis]KAB0798986.1 hypothetical protein PPYR_06866 [Photinus pyralis]
MTNKPFTSQSTNISTETTYSSAPSRCGNEPVVITNLTKRSLYEQSITSIYKNGLPFKKTACNSYYPARNYLMYNNSQCDIIPGLKEFFPGGLSFSFNQVGHHFTNQSPNPLYTQCWPPQDPNRLELMLQPDPTPLKFHYEESTTTADMPNSTHAIQCSLQTSTTNRETATSEETTQTNGAESKKSTTSLSCRKSKRKKKSKKKKSTPADQDSDSPYGDLYSDNAESQ